MRTCQTTSEKGKTWQITAESSQRWIASLNVFEDSKASSESLHLIYLMDHDGRLSWGADEFAQMSSLGATCAVETPLEFKARLLVPVHPRFESRTYQQFLQLARLHQCEAKFHVVSTCSDPGILSHIREIQRTFIQKKAPQGHVFSMRCNSVLHWKLHGWLNCLLIAFLCRFAVGRRQTRLLHTEDWPKVCYKWRATSKGPSAFGVLGREWILMRLFGQIKTGYFQAFD